MKPDTVIEEQMILEANNDHAFTAQGKLIAKLPPKRRFKTSAEHVPAFTLMTKIGSNETISDGMARFVSHLHLAEAR